MTRPYPPDASALAELAAPPDTTLPNGFTVELADDALYRAKHAGRDRVEVGAESA